MTDSTALAEQTSVSSFSLTPRNLDEAFKLADMLASSELVPKDFRGKPANVLVAVQWGAEIGLKPMQALQNIAVINGRPSLWGDAQLALVRADARCEYVVENDEGGTAVCRVKRRGEPEQIRTFSDADAKTAKLFGKEGPWQTSPKRMKQMRARSFALRDVFPDVLKGLPMAEEVMDIPFPSDGGAPTPTARPSKDLGAAHVVKPDPLTEDQLSAWRKASEGGTEQSRLFWEAAGAPFRKAATVDQKETMWAVAVAADAHRTVDNADAAPVATTADTAEFVADMDAAERKATAT